MTPRQAVNRFAAYLVLSTCILLVLIWKEDFRDPYVALTRMVTFAIAVTAIGYIMVRCGAPLPLAPVDTINHAAAILAAVIFFVGDHKDRQEIVIEKEREEAELALKAVRAQLLVVEAEKSRGEERLEALLRDRSQGEDILAQEEVARIVAQEMELSLALQNTLGLTQEVQDALVKLVQDCRTREDQLDGLRSLISPRFQTAPTLELDLGQNRWDAPWRGIEMEDAQPSPDEVIALSSLMDDVNACRRKTEGVAESLAAPPGFERLLGLWAISPHRIAGVPTAAQDVDAETLGQIGSILKIQSARTIIREADRSIAATEVRLSATSERIGTLSARERGLETKLDGLDEETQRNSEQNFVQVVSQAREFGKMTWPFLLILFLGMKFACTRPFALPPSDNSQRKAT